MGLVSLRRSLEIYIHILIKIMTCVNLFSRVFNTFLPWVLPLRWIFVRYIER